MSEDVGLLPTHEVESASVWQEVKAGLGNSDTLLALEALLKMSAQVMEVENV